MFQSLSGFQVRCNFIMPGSGTRYNMSFNPYRVFKFVATAGSNALGKISHFVSIPIGFSSSLQPTQRFFGGSIREWFQSLSGFQVRCNSFKRNFHSSRYGGVSIPIGFSSSLQRSGEHVSNSYLTRFQSLSGFQVRCNPEAAIMSQQPG